MEKKITVIGGSGFVGTNLCKFLESIELPFEIIDLKMSNQYPMHCKIADVRNLDVLRQKITGDIIIDLAAIHRDDVVDQSEYYKTNVEGAKNIATVCNEKNISKIIFVSSVAVYGFAPNQTDEYGEINPFNKYGETKYQAEEMYRTLFLNENTSLTIIRPTVIFGEGNRGNVYNLFNQIALGRFIMIGSGKNKKSMAYIHNVIAFIYECIMSNENYMIFNYVDTPDMDMNTLVKSVRNTLLKKSNIGLRIPYHFGLLLGFLADKIAKVLNKKLPLSAIRVKKFCSSSEFKSSKNKLNNFTPPHTLSEGIQKTLIKEFVDPDETREIFYTE
jgi:nucleoside-diphosphate-sugar epimerase